MASAPTVTTEEITVALPAELLREIDAEAAKQHLGRDEVIERGVFYYLSTLRWRELQAIAAPRAKAAGLLTEDDVEEYLDSLPDSD